MDWGGKNMIHIENTQQFDEVIKEGITLVDFYATWCGPCRMLSPFIEELDSEYGEKVKVVKLDVDECGEVASRFAVNAIPAIMIFKDNELKKTSVGFLPKEDIVKLIESVLGE